MARSSSAMISSIVLLAVANSLLCFALWCSNCHCHCGDPADNIRFRWIPHLADLSSGLRIRDQEQLVSVQLTPTAGVTISKLDEKDGAVEFVLPGAWLDLTLPLIDLDE